MNMNAARALRSLKCLCIFLFFNHSNYLMPSSALALSAGEMPGI